MKKRPAVIGKKCRPATSLDNRFAKPTDSRCFLNKFQVSSKLGPEVLVIRPEVLISLRIAVQADLNKFQVSKFGPEVLINVTAALIDLIAAYFESELQCLSGWRQRGSKGDDLTTAII